MGLFREKLTVEAAMRLTLSASVKRDPGHALLTVAASGALPRATLEAMAVALLPFEVAVWHQLWMQYATESVPDAELSQRFMISLAFALRDSSLPTDQQEELLDSLIQTTEEYSRFVGGQPADSVLQNGPYAFLCHRFTTHVIGDADIMDANVQLELVHVFDIARQSCEAARAALTALGKQYKITVS